MERETGTEPECVVELKMEREMRLAQSPYSLF